VDLREALKVLESVPNMYLVLSPDLMILTASDLFLKATQTTRESISGRHIFDAFPDNPELPGADGVQNINASLQEVLHTGQPHFMDIQRYDVPDVDHPGKFITRYWEPSHTPVFNNNGDIWYIIQHANNITEKVLRLTELAESRKLEYKALQKIELLNLELDVLRISELEHEKNERHFRYLADLVPAKICNLLPAGEATYFNKHWLDYSGFNVEELKDYGYHNIMHPEEIQKFQHELKKANHDRSRYECEMRFRDTSGNYNWHLNIVSPVLDEYGEIVMWVGSATNIQRLKDEEQRKSDFIAMVSHELKTPLTSLMAYIQLLTSKSSVFNSKTMTDILSKSLNQIKKMTAMIEGFMNVSRLENQGLTLILSKFDFSALLEEIKDDFRDTVISHNLYFEPNETTVTLSADRTKIEQVIKNLISNAIKYSPPETSIVISYKIFPKEMLFTVADQGYGISKDQQKRIFERYYRIESELSRTTAGFGIGLYFCLEMINMHHGQLSVESNLDCGSTFTFTLPISVKNDLPY
jgi:PAS domain S-box-containing protein